MGEHEVLVVVELAGLEPLLGLLGAMALQHAHRHGIDGNRSATPIGLRHGHLDPVPDVDERLTDGEALESGGEFHDLAAHGLPIAIDAFGVGYSSLRYLHVHPVHTLKIDHAFVSTIDRGPRETAVPNAVIRLGHGLGFRVTAECVETQAQARRLVELGCDHLSGYLLAPPVPERDLVEAQRAAEAALHLV